MMTSFSYLGELSLQLKSTVPIIPTEETSLLKSENRIMLDLSQVRDVLRVQPQSHSPALSSSAFLLDNRTPK